MNRAAQALWVVTFVVLIVAAIIVAYMAFKQKATCESKGGAWIARSGICIDRKVVIP